MNKYSCICSDCSRAVNGNENDQIVIIVYSVYYTHKYSQYYQNPQSFLITDYTNSSTINKRQK